MDKFLHYNSFIDTNLIHNFFLYKLHKIKLSTTTQSCFLFNKMITYSKYNKAIIHFYRMRITEAAYMYN